VLVSASASGPTASASRPPATAPAHSAAPSPVARCAPEDTDRPPHYRSPCPPPHRRHTAPMLRDPPHSGAAPAIPASIGLTRIARPKIIPRAHSFSSHSLSDEHRLKESWNNSDHRASVNRLRDFERKAAHSLPRALPWSSQREGSDRGRGQYCPLPL
jgi:hypothetical protein